MPHKIGPIVAYGAGPGRLQGGGWVKLGKADCNLSVCIQECRFKRLYRVACGQQHLHCGSSIHVFGVICNIEVADLVQINAAPGPKFRLPVPDQLTASA